MKLVVALALACGFTAAPLLAAADASGAPSCDSPACVPYVARNVAQGTPCIARTRYVFGVDSSSGSTLLCDAKGQWIQSKPLIGLRLLGNPCYGSAGAAQSPDGLPLACRGPDWTANFTDIYYID
ncbi:MAG: hypothetical protein QOE41_3956 [Mycobacterium sp.]|nr:hypothetical protein [Mycobacterium sp.]MDT5134645.1 hypothetical protein [Mycobacterium sp.]